MFDTFRPAYVSRGGITDVDYGNEAWMLAWADVTPDEHAAIIANADATAVPANLDSTVGGALAATQAKLEAANLPAQWITAGMTWRAVLKGIIRVLLIMQRFRGLNGAAARLFAQVTLDNTVGDIPIGARQRLVAAATSLGLDTAAITLTDTIRSALVTLGQQMTVPILMRGETL